jgi:Flp pilus assembly protein TadG
MSILAISGALIMMVFGGIGIDLMHAELRRTKLQNTLDRAVLAAADLDNKSDAKATVIDYFRAMDMSDALDPTKIVVDKGLNFKDVTASGSVQMPTLFTHLIGHNSMSVEGTARAEERINKVEISMVLDISGSMRDNQKMTNLKKAANTFVDTLLTTNNKDMVSISMVPYSQHVNAGPTLTNYFNVDWDHGFSHCLEFPDSHFDSVPLNTSHRYEQAQHFQWNYSGWNDLTQPICPRYSYERISPFSQNATALKSQINSFQPRAGTQIFIGMKWAAGLLDPAFRSITSQMAANNQVDAAFSARPGNYDDPDTLKTIVLMTDGQNSSSNRIRDWAYSTPSDVSHWSRYNLNYFLYRYVRRYQRSQYYMQKYTANQGDQLLDKICTAAKNKGIIIWTIGFEVEDHGANVMRKCASSDSHYFRVEGVAIEDAFYSVARTIAQLRLIQ